MNRRTVLRRSGAFAALGLAGCLGTDDGSTPDDNQTDDPGDGDGSPTSPTDDGEVTIVDSAVETLGSGCGSPDDSSAAISPNAEQSRLTISGTFVAGTPCQTIVLEDLRYDPAADTLTVAVGAETTDENCVECVGAVDYEARIDFEAALPGTTVVTHGGEVVASSGQAVTMQRAELTLTDAPPGGRIDTGADVRFDADRHAVAVTGTIAGSDGCKTAVLDGATYDAEADVLTVDVVTTDREGTGDQMCTQALVFIDYEAAFEFEDGLPGTVEVRHDGEGVTTAGYSEASAGDDGTPTTLEEPPTPTLVDSRFAVVGRDPGQSLERATLEFDTDRNRVVVTGAIEGSDGCKTAALGDVSYDAAADHLSVDVVTENRAGTEGQACTQALVSIGYEVVVEFAGGLPSEASVSHDGDGIAGGAWASNSASDAGGSDASS